MASQNNIPDPSQEEVIKNWEENWRKEEQSITYPHTRKEFTFTKTELRQLLQQGTIEALGLKVVEFSKSAANEILNGHALPRVGIVPDSSTKVLYDLSSGRFMIWIPKPATEAIQEGSTPIISEETQ